MKKAVSPLIAYILLIGMVVATSAIVANYLIKQANTISYESKEIEIYCNDVAVDAVPLCKRNIPSNPDSSFKILELTLTNRGYFNVSSLTVIREETTIVSGQKKIDMLASEEFGYYPYKEDGTYTDPQGNPIQAPIRPNKKAMLQIVIDTDKSNEMTITPWISFDEKIAACDEKAFKVESNPNDNILSCTP
ncbi:hypothetical protein J4427_00035 [Candidatus Woesearchaeota archaeon]|nr:hypothetical protein [Candidatus Woesearchaeota archaeon]